MKTVKVKIAVAVDSSGDWNAAGWSKHDGEYSDTGVMDFVISHVSCGGAKYWVEAELPIPETKIVQGTASKAES